MATGELHEMGSNLERAFDTYWRALAPPGLPDPLPLVPFGRWEIDRAWPQYRIAVELDGGVGGGYGRPVTCHNCGVRVRAIRKDGTPGKELRIGGGHSRGRGFERDREKRNALQDAGWEVYAFTSAQVYEDPEAVISKLAKVLRRAGIKQPLAGELTRREMQVLQLVAQGHQYADIAERLDLAERTITDYMSKARVKLGAKTKAAATAKAVAWRLIDVDLVVSQGVGPDGE